MSTGHDPHVYHFVQIPLPLALGLDAMTWLNKEGLTLCHWKPPFASLFQILSLWVRSLSVTVEKPPLRTT